MFWGNGLSITILWMKSDVTESMMRHLFSQFVLLFSAVSNFFWKKFDWVRWISKFLCHNFKCRGPSILRYSVAIRNDFFSQLLSNRYYLTVVQTQAFLSYQIWFCWKLLQQTRYLFEQIKESLEIVFVFSVSIYDCNVYFQYRLHKHAIRPSLIQLYYL